MVLGVKGTYDGFDRTTGIKIGGVTTSFDYNTDSDRVSKTTNGKVTESILDNGSVSADLIGETLKVFSEDNSVFCQKGVFSYNVINTKGDIIALAGSNGIDYNYNAYGTELYKYSSANPIGYRNYYYDSETGLYYLKARYYDPTTGQFTQEDTVQDDNLQYNLYGYCSANPVLYFDPSGHDAIILLSSESVKGLGHMGLLFQNAANWYYWYWGMSVNKGIPQYALSALFHINNTKLGAKAYKILSTNVSASSKLVFVSQGKGITSSTSLKKIDQKITKANARYKEYFEKGLYIKGNFSKAFDYLCNMSYRGKYNLLHNNCMQTSVVALSRCNLYRDKFIKAEKMVVPNHAYNYLKRYFKSL